MLGVAWGQRQETTIKVYAFDDGLSHRNVFHITQDSVGLIWIGAINGLNRFDGYNFEHFDRSQGLPADMVADMVVTSTGALWLASPDFLSYFQDSIRPFQIKEGDLIRREALAPNNLCLGPGDKLWCTLFDERTGTNSLASFDLANGLQRYADLPGVQSARPLAQWQGQLWLGASGTDLWQIDPASGAITQHQLDLPGQRIVDLQVARNQLWLSLNNGMTFSIPKIGSSPEPFAGNANLPAPLRISTARMEADGDLWLGGLGTLWYYDNWRQQWVDFDQSIRQLVKNTCTYRQIFQDESGVIWLATDFGAIKITQSDRLFTQYLSGGSEYCSDIYCSTRGITEDDQGRIYIAYYNSIHVLDPKTNDVRPLFPNNDYFNFPFGITYHRGYLYTGNGIRINLSTLRRDTLFGLPNIDLGAVIVDQSEQIWIGYQYHLFRYDPAREELHTFTDALGVWDSLAGNISHLQQGPVTGDIWVSTLDQGLYRLDPITGRKAHYTTAEDSPVRLPHIQVNATYEDSLGNLWLATARGLAHLRLSDLDFHLYTSADGLPNDFINGILPEGDSCLWVSTDNGLCRFSLTQEECLNFFESDGLSANEFNRISFYRSRSGRLYFGGLNGVNAFTPDLSYLQRKQARLDAPLLLTRFSYLDGVNDSLVVRRLDRTAEQITDFELSFRDHMFSAEFALADFRYPSQNSFRYKLENYDAEWSPATTVPSVRYTDIAPGKYILRVQARAGREDWSTQELRIPIHIAPAYYQRWWFWLLAGIAALSLVLGLVRYRVFALEKRRRELEHLVGQRTQELEAEKQKSEELLLNILPAELADELKRNGSAKARRHEAVTVMFSDFRGFSRISGLLEPEELVAEIDLCFRAFDEITERHGLEKIKTIGDAYLLVGGISSNDQEQAIKVVKAALEIQEFMGAIALERRLSGRHYFEARIGIHTGPLVAGIVGIKKFAYDIWGDTVNIASRMETTGEVGEVNISESTYQLVKDFFRCEEHGVFSEHSTELAMYLVKEYVGAL
ncbi:MAG: hypothetical protein KDC54_17480 [Lewinella sp.]|nr:hypothetical protein [Lewinella sp.]